MLLLNPQGAQRFIQGVASLLEVDGFLRELSGGRSVMTIDAFLRQRLAQSGDALGKRTDCLREIDVRILLECLSEALRAPALDDVSDRTIAGPIDRPVAPVSEVLHAFRDAPGGLALRGLLLEALSFGDAGIDGVNCSKQILDSDLLYFELLVTAYLLRLEFRPSFRLIDVEGRHEIPQGRPRTAFP